MDERVVVERVVNERLAALSAKSFDELAALPHVSSEDIVRDRKKFRLSVWHDVLDAGERRIVVQAAQRSFLGFAWRMHAQGFVVNTKNERRALTEEERESFS